MKVAEPPIIVSEVFAVSAQRLWQAVTNAEEMKQWFFPQMPDFKPEVGFKTQFVVEHNGRTFTHTWQIVEVEPLRKVKFSWRYPEYPGDSTVSLELSPEGDKTRLTLTTQILADYPDDIPEFTRESCQGGWNYFIKESLKNYLQSA